MAYKKLSDFVLVKEYCDADECTGHDCYWDSFTCEHWVREYVPLNIKQLIENDKLTYKDIECRIVKGGKIVQEFEVINNYIEERHEDWIGKTHIPVIIADYEKIKEADEKPIDYKALKEFKETVKEFEDRMKNPKLDATRKWCSLSNAIIKKYRAMVDNDDEATVISDLNYMKMILKNNFNFKEEDFKDWGE